MTANISFKCRFNETKLIVDADAPPIKFYTNRAKGDGVLSAILQDIQADEVAVAITVYYESGRQHQCSKYGKMTKNQVEMTVKSDHHLYEIMMETRQQKVAFDIDVHGVGVSDPYEKCIKIITDQFPDARLFVSGSRVMGQPAPSPLAGGQEDMGEGEEPFNHFSYHIIIGNYVVDGSALEHTRPLQNMCNALTEYGFDPNLYKKNGQIKMVNQSKRDGRVQRIITGGADVLDHTVMHNIPVDAINIKTLDFSHYEPTKPVQVRVGRAKDHVIDVSASVSRRTDLSVPAEWDPEGATPLECLMLLPNEPRASQFAFNHQVEWNVMRWCKGIGLNFEDTWKWLGKKDESATRLSRYMREFKECDVITYPIKSKTIWALLVQTYGPSVQESITAKWMKKKFNTHFDKKIEGTWVKSKELDVPEKHVILNLPLGGGKSSAVIEYICDFAEKYPKKSILFITCRIALTNDQQGQLSKTNLKFMSYQNFSSAHKKAAANPNAPEPEQYQYLMNSVHSLLYCGGGYDLIVIDESEVVMRSFHLEKSCQVDIVANWMMLKALVKSAEKVFWMDGLLKDTTLNYINAVDPGASKIIVGRDTPQAERFFLECVNGREQFPAEAFHGEIFKSLDLGEKIFVCLAKKGEQKVANEGSVEHLASTLCHRMGWTEGKEIIWYHGGKTTAKRMLKDIEEIWARPEVRCVIANSALAVGVNFNTPGVFDRIFARFNPNCNGHHDFFQLLYRVRNPISNVMILLVDKVCSAGKNNDNKYKTPDDPIYDALVRDVKVEECADRRTSNRQVFNLYCKKMNIKFKRGGISITQEAAAEIEAIYDASDVMFAWKKIKSLSQADVEHIEEAREHVLVQFETIQQLEMAKYYFRWHFPEDTEEKILEYLWNDYRYFVKCCADLKREDCSHGKTDAARVVSRLLEQNNIIVGDAIPKLVQFECDRKLIAGGMFFYKQPLTFRQDNIAKILETFFRMKVLDRKPIAKSKKHYEWVTDPKYCTVGKMCRDLMTLYQDHSKSRDLLKGYEILDSLHDFDEDEETDETPSAKRRKL